MKRTIRLTESELVELIEKMVNEQVLLWTTPGINMMAQTLLDRCSSSFEAKELCYSVGEVAFWFIPVIGPYMSAALGVIQGIDYIKHGHKALGILYLMTSPLMISRVITIFRFFKPTEESAKLLNILTKINKSGLPVFYVQGEQAFFRWVEKNFGKEFKDLLIKVFNSKELDKEFKKGFNAEVKPLMKDWVKDNPTEYSKLSAVDRKKISELIK